MVKIYTKTGDKGETSLFGGKRVSKSSLRIEAIGSIDELNSAIGVVIAQVSSINIKKELVVVQNDLFEIGSLLARPRIMKQESLRQSSGQAGIKNLERRVISFEKTIDELTKKLPELRNFILPSGGEAGSLLHLARSICRRAERRIVTLSKKEQVEPSILQYFNRLSDLLFTTARFVNYEEKKKETIWSS